MPRCAAVALFLLLVVLSTRLLVSMLLHGVLANGGSLLLYQAATDSFNYIDFGFVRRGLGGTVVRLLGPDRLVATAIFHVLSTAALAFATCLLWARIAAPPVRRAVFAILLAALFMRWAEDAGRTDMLVAALLAVAALAMRERWPLLACLAVAVGLFVHEIAFIFGLPLLLALALDGGRWRRYMRGEFAGVAGILLGAVGFYAAFRFLPHADAATMVAAVQGSLPRHEHVDWAIYFAISGARGVQTSLCQNAGDPTWGRHTLTGLLVVACFAALLDDGASRRRWLVALAAVPGFLFLAVVANDFSRWTVLAAFNVWLLHAVTTPGKPALQGRRSGKLRIGPALFMVFLIHPRILPVHYAIYVPSPPIDRVAERLGFALTQPVSEALARCDPDWQEVLTAPLR